MYNMHADVPDPAELEEQQDKERIDLDTELDEHDAALAGEETDDDDDEDDDDDDDEDKDDEE